MREATSTYEDASVVGAHLTARASSLSEKLNERVRQGVLAFPLTAFSEDGERLDLVGFRRHIRRHIDSGAAALFVACGTGEYSALSEAEYADVVAVAVDEARRELPVLSGIGYGWSQARSFARIADDAGIDGLLVLPHYLVSAPQSGTVENLQRIAQSTECPLIVYQRGLVRLDSETLAAIAEIPTVVGLKDGHGDLATLHHMKLTMPPEFLFFNGALTAEVQHKLYSSIGVPAYSSAFHSCAPEISRAFYDASRTGNHALVDKMLRDIYYPFIELRDEVPGYAVSLIKAAARLRGENVGPVRAPLVDPNADHLRQLEKIIRHGLALVGAEF